MNDSQGMTDDLNQKQGIAKVQNNFNKSDGKTHNKIVPQVQVG